MHLLSQSYNHGYIQLLNYKSQLQRKKMITEKEVTEWKSTKNHLPEKPSVVGWDDDDVPNTVHLNEFYSSMEEQTEIVKKIKELFQQKPSISTSPTFDPSLKCLATEASFSKVIQLMKEQRYEDIPRKNVIGVAFNTEKEVSQFCNLLRAEGINVRSSEKEDTVREWIIVSRVAI